MQDKIVKTVIQKYIERSELGINKYGTTLHGSKESFTNFLNHLQEELFDASLYVQVLLERANKENDKAFLIAQNEYLKENLAKLNNEVFMLREIKRHKDEQNG